MWQLVGCLWLLVVGLASFGIFLTKCAPALTANIPDPEAVASPVPVLVQAILKYGDGQHDKDAFDPSEEDWGRYTFVEHVWPSVPPPFDSLNFEIERVKGKEKSAWCMSMYGSQLLDVCRDYKVTAVTNPEMSWEILRVEDGPLKGKIAKQLLRGSEIMTPAYLACKEPYEAQRIAKIACGASPMVGSEAP